MLTNNHIFICTVKEIEQITKPLFEFLGINFFVYSRAYNDGGSIYLSTSPAWILHFHHQKYFQISRLSGNPQNYRSGFALWDHWSKNHDSYRKVGKDMRDNFNFNHGLSILRKHEEYLERFEMTTNLNNERINSFYLSYMEAIQKFCDYFVNNTLPLIQQAENHKIYHPFNSQTDDLSLLIEDGKEKYFLEAIQIKKLNLLLNRGLISFSKRETDCIRLLIECKSVKEIGKELKISHRTVESYIDAIKIKFGCHTKSEIINIIKRKKVLNI